MLESSRYKLSDTVRWDCGYFISELDTPDVTDYIFAPVVNIIEVYMLEYFYRRGITVHRTRLQFNGL